MSDTTPAGPRRRPATGGYPRGDEKRAIIIAVALRRFGEDGYDAASTRQIAHEAGVNPPALQYYFNGKEGLYLACGRYVAEAFVRSMQVTYRQAEKVPKGNAAAAVDALCDIVDAVADFLFETAEAEGWARFLARSQSSDSVGPSDAVEAQAIEGDLFKHSSRLVGLALAQDPASLDTRLRTLAIMGQLSAFHLGFDDALRKLHWPDLRGPRLRKLKEILRSQTAAALGMAPTQRGLSRGTGQVNA